MMKTTLDVLNLAPTDVFAGMLYGVFEHAPWVATQTAAARPFASVAALHAAMMQMVEQAEPVVQFGFLNGHPELASIAPMAGLTADSIAEQAGLGMAGAVGRADLPEMNLAYRARFGFPFIVCAARHTAANVLREIARRLANDPATEVATALREIGHITRLRLVQRVDGPGLPLVAGSMSSHVLDQSTGLPGVGVVVTLLQEKVQVATATTDADGRIRAGLVPAGPLRQGHYEMVFATGAHFAASATPTLYDTIPIRFVVSEAEAHYHVPLLVAPYGYGTYRGS